MIRNVQALRFLAALAVALYHAGVQYRGLPSGDWLGPIFDLFVPHGMLGVDVFFAVSGFIIWHTTAGLQGLRNSAQFLAKRLTRIYLGYWPWLAMMAAAMHYRLGEDLATYNVTGSLLLFPLGGKLILIVAWSLTVEVVCYAVFAVSMMLPRRRMILGVLAIWSSAAVLLAGQGAGIAFTPFIVEFAAGAFLAAAVERHRTPSPLWLLPALIVGLWLASSFDSTESTLARVFLATPFAVSAVLLALSLEARGRTAGDALVRLGDASYALYLCHVPVILVAMPWFWREVAAAPGAAMLAMVAVSIGLALVWYLAVERHVTGACHRLIASALRGGRLRALATIPAIPAIAGAIGRGTTDDP